MAQREQVELGIKLLVESGSVDALTNALTSGVAKATTEGGKRAQKQYTEHIANATSAAVRRVFEGRTVSNLLSKALNAEKMNKAIVAAYEKGDTEHAKALERERKRDMKHLAALAERRKKNFQDYAELQDRTFTQTADDFNERLSSGVSNLFSGNIDVGGLVKKLGAKAQQRGDSAITRGQSVDASRMEKAMGRLGSVMSGMGTALMGLGGVETIVTTLVQAFITLDTKIKDMNKAMTESAGAADFGLGTAGQAAAHMSSQLEEIRGQILEQAADWEGYRQSSESMFQVLSAMNQMNFTFKQMRKEIDDTTNSITSYADISIRAVAYGKLMGVSTQQMGENMAQMANEFGVGLDTISQGFHMVHKEAVLSGFSTKRFYSTILEVTSGLGQYNVRLSEAAGLLAGMGAAMGEARGEALFKGTVGDQSFKGKSPVDALKDLLLKGQKGKVASIFADEAAASAGKFYEALNPEQREKVGKRFKLDTSSAQAFGEAFAKAAPDQAALLAYLGDIQASGEASNYAQTAGRHAKAGKGDIDRQTAAYSELGAAGRLRMMMLMPEFSAHQDLSTLLQEGLTPEIQAVIDAMGISMDQFRELADFQGRLGSEFDAMAKEAKGMAEGKVIDRGEFGKFRKVKGGFQKVDDTETENLSGVFNDVDSYLAAQNDFIEQDQKVIDEDLELGRQIAANTEDFSRVIEENIAVILNKIYSTLVDIWHWISGDKQKRDQLKSFRTSFEKAHAKKVAFTEEAEKAAQAKVAAATASGDKSALAAAQTELTDVQKRKSMLTAVQGAAPTIDPTEFDSVAAYTEAVYAAAGVDQASLPKIAGDPTEQKGPARPQGRGEAGGRKALLDKLLGATEDWSLNPSVHEVWGPLESILRDEYVSGLSGEPKAQWEDLIALIREQYLTGLPGAPKNDLGLSHVTGLNQWAINQIELALSGALDWSAVQGASKAFDTSILGNAQGFMQANDMYVPSNGRPVMLNSADSVLAMKPGGAVDKAMGRGGGNVTINVKNYGNPREVQKAVIRGIKIARGEPFAQ